MRAESSCQNPHTDLLEIDEHFTDHVPQLLESQLGMRGAMQQCSPCPTMQQSLRARQPTLPRLLTYTIIFVRQPDVDVILEGPAGKVSRKQAKLELKCDGCFYLRNLGARVVYVNNTQLNKVFIPCLGCACSKLLPLLALPGLASQPLCGAATARRLCCHRKPQTRS